MKNLCDSPFWDTNITWHSSNPDFTECFKKTALQWIPCAFLWIFLPLELYNLKTSKTPNIPYNKLNLTKLIAIICTIGTSIVELGNNVWIHNIEELADIITPMIKICSFTLFLLLTLGKIKVGIRTSGVSFFFSLLSVVCAIPAVRDIFQINSEKMDTKITLDCYLFAVYYISTIIIFVLNCFADRKPSYSLADKKKQCPSHDSSFLSNLYFHWFTQFVWIGYKNPLKDILWNVDYEDTAEGILHKFDKIWNDATSTKKQKKVNENEGISLEESDSCEKKTDHSVVGPIIKLVWFQLLQTMFWRALDICMTLSSPLIFSLLISTIRKEKDHIWKAYLCVFLYFISPLIVVVISRKYFETVLKVQIRTRNVIMSLVYKKTLKLSNEARKQYSGGDIVNFMSVDVTRICEFIKQLNHTWSAPTQIIITLFILWGYFGTSIIASIITIGVILMTNSYIVRLSKKLRIQEMHAKDKRSQFLQEILSGIKVLKMYAWESSFEKIANKMRHVEMQYLRKLAIYQVIMALFFSSTPFVLPLITIATYILSNSSNVLDVEKAFICISFFNTFRMPMYHMPNLYNMALQAFVSIKRINKFLNLEEIDPNEVTHEKGEEALVIENGEFAWEKNQKTPTLKNINLRIKQGSLVAIVGQVGSGKSSLISAFLGELPKKSGRVNVNGSTAYVPQQAWILNTTVKENITMGEIVDNKLYTKALQACALKSDLQIMHDDDQTEIGEKGINLSGGQKQRISLARAVCSNKDIYFFDDPLSAVDYTVAEHIFQYVLGPQSILNNKTRILVTHSTDFLHKMDFIVVMKNGSITEKGTYEEIMRDNGKFAEFLKCYGKETDKKNTNIEDELDRDINNPVLRKQISEAKIDLKNSIIDSKNSINNLFKSKENDLNLRYNYEPKKLIQKEHVEVGNIKFDVYKYYFTIAGPFFVYSTFCLYLAFQTFSVLSNLWLASWSNKEEEEEAISKADTSQLKKDNPLNLSVFLILGICQVLSIVLANISMQKFLLKSSVTIYNNLLENVLRWPMSIFDSTPVGRIINRFTVDMDAIDNNLAGKLAMLSLFCSRLIAVSLVIMSHTPICSIFLIPAVFLIFVIQKFYMVISHQLKRIDSIYRSPLYSHFVETMSGLESIRAYNFQEKFIKNTYHKYDLCSATVYSIFVCSRWLNTRLEILVGIIIALTSFFVISGRDMFNEGVLAFIITYTIQISKEVNLMITNLTEVENVIVSVERIKEFIDNPREPDQRSEIPPDWPAKGEIKFESYKLRYRPGLNLVLRDVNFHIRSKEKVGIIGRTGAGKTSIISAIFRIVERTSGKIYIDGIDISTLNLRKLRSKLTVIPQDPVLFAGTLRFNLDPFQAYHDSTLWDVLEKAHLKDFVRNLPDRLEYQIKEGGGNLSFGQKQLICLARALLRKTKILILDEATASVDLETDELIQKTIRKEFYQCTVITIAHRLNTVQDYDKILVMENGTVKEFDTVENLLNRKDSIFYKLALDSGILPNEIRNTKKDS
ncbi:multidrug resistance-associated protein 1-like [Planococcus citri]|uniref:multidrug resistance-associated protein 1-like n=1 Tax=Planococcus citri TaxID=170843 RepID=UPI0031F7C340